MFELTRTQMVALGFAFGLAILGTILVQHSEGKVGDFFGLLSVVVGVMVAALTNMETDPG